MRCELFEYKKCQIFLVFHKIIPQRSPFETLIFSLQICGCHLSQNLPRHAIYLSHPRPTGSCPSSSSPWPSSTKRRRRTGTAVVHDAICYSRRSNYWYCHPNSPQCSPSFDSIRGSLTNMTPLLQAVKKPLFAVLPPLIFSPTPPPLSVPLQR